MRAGQMFGVAGHPPPYEVRERLGTALSCVGFTFENERASPLAHHEAVAIHVVRARSSLGIALVGPRQSARVAEACHRVESGGSLASTGDHDICFAREDHHRRDGQRVVARRARAGDVEARPHETVLHRDQRRHRVQHDPGDEVRRYGARAALGRATNLLFEDLDRPLPGRHEDPYPGGIDTAESRLADRFGRSGDRKLLDPTVDVLLLLIEPLGGFETFDRRCYVAA